MLMQSRSITLVGALHLKINLSQCVKGTAILIQIVDSDSNAFSGIFHTKQYQDVLVA
jgi:hypothetical protein